MRTLEYIIPASAARSGKNSLMVPASKLGYYERQCEARGSRRAYCRRLVQAYLPCMHIWQKQLLDLREPNWNTAYQARKQNLQKRNFYANAEDWELLRLAAAACGVSICFLFSFLMTLEATGFPGPPETPTREGGIPPQTSRQDPKSLESLLNLRLVWNSGSPPNADASSIPEKIHQPV